jgi:hypothetical protein
MPRLTLVKTKHSPVAEANESRSGLRLIKLVSIYTAVRYFQQLVELGTSTVNHSSSDRHVGSRYSGEFSASSFRKIRLRPRRPKKTSSNLEKNNKRPKVIAKTELSVHEQDRKHRGKEASRQDQWIQLTQPSCPDATTIPRYESSPECCSLTLTSNPELCLCLPISLLHKTLILPWLEQHVKTEA